MCTISFHTTTIKMLEIQRNVSQTVAHHHHSVVNKFSGARDGVSHVEGFFFFFWTPQGIWELHRCSVLCILMTHPRNVSRKMDSRIVSFEEQDYPTEIIKGSLLRTQICRVRNSGEIYPTNTGIKAEFWTSVEMIIFFTLSLHCVLKSQFFNVGYCFILIYW